MPENVSVVVKNPVALSCEASGIPLPAISWLKDGRPIKASSSVHILSGKFLFDFLGFKKTQRCKNFFLKNDLLVFYIMLDIYISTIKFFVSLVSLP